MFVGSVGSNFLIVSATVNLHLSSCTVIHCNVFFSDYLNENSTKSNL